jgi:putative nucleotidyltransferase with HDIG domain
MSATAARGRASDGPQLRRYLPLALAVTLAVIVLPLLAVAQLGPARGPLAVAWHVAVAALLSMAVARLLALLWSRTRHSSDLVFGDLLLWGWARRARAERRLDSAARSLSAPPAAGEDRETLLRKVSSLLERRYPYTHGHSKRVARHAERIAGAMGLPREEVERIRMAALVHDIGKINIPRAILQKPGRLTDAEFALVKRHAADGAVMVAELGDPGLTAIVRHHHERLDGAGYPDGLAGDDIPLGARIVAVADTFDAMTSDRPYRARRSHREALEVVRAEAGTQLDPAAVAAFTGYYSAGGSVGWAAAALAAPQRLISGLGGVAPGVAAGAAPLAQTACGVGAAALLSACIGVGPVKSDDPAGDRAPARAVVVASAPQDPVASTAPGGAPQARGEVGRAAPPQRGGRTRRVDRSLQPPPTQPGGEATQPRESTDPGDQGGVVPEVDVPGTLPADVPETELPDPAATLDPVIDLLPPPVQDALPALQVPQLQTPGVQVPSLQLGERPPG